MDSNTTYSAVLKKKWFARACSVAIDLSISELANEHAVLLPLHILIQNTQIPVTNMLILKLFNRTSLASG